MPRDTHYHSEFNIFKMHCLHLNIKQTEIEDDFQKSKNQKHIIRAKKKEKTPHLRSTTSHANIFLPFKMWYMFRNNSNGR
jgi:hypothetical protein